MAKFTKSLPARGAWIEMADISVLSVSITGRSPHGERGLKFIAIDNNIVPMAVAPRTGSVD